MDPQVKLERLEGWLSEHGVECKKEFVTLQAGVRGSGCAFGVIATKDLAEGDIVCTMPKSAVLSFKNCGISDIIEEAMIIGEVATAMALMYEKSIGKKSTWFGYIEALPDFEPLPYFWSKEEKEYLVGTDVESIVENYENLLREDYETLVEPLVKEHPDRMPASFFTFENFFKASSLVSSRAFNVDSFHGDSMVPLADIFNHKTAAENVHFESDDACPVCGRSDDCEHMVEADGEEEGEGDENGEDAEADEAEEDEGEGEGKEIEIEYEAESGNEHEEKAGEANDSHTNGAGEKETEGGCEGCDDDTCCKPANKDDAPVDQMEMVIVRPAKKGEEVFNTFGELPNSCLLTKYGFTEPENPFDTVDISPDLILSVLKSKDAKNQFATYMKKFDQEMFEVGYNGEAEESFVKAIYFASEKWKTVGAALKLTRRATAKQILDGKLGGTVCATISKILEERSKRYPTSKEDDEKTMKETQNPNVRWALTLRISERDIIAKAQTVYHRANATTKDQEQPAQQNSGAKPQKTKRAEEKQTTNKKFRK